MLVTQFLPGANFRSKGSTSSLHCSDMSHLGEKKRERHDITKMYKVSLLAFLTKIVARLLESSLAKGKKSLMVSSRDRMDASKLHAHGSFFLFDPGSTDAEIRFAGADTAGN